MFKFFNLKSFKKFVEAWPDLTLYIYGQTLGLKNYIGRLDTKAHHYGSLSPGLRACLVYLTCLFTLYNLQRLFQFNKMLSY